MLFSLIDVFAQPSRLISYDQDSINDPVVWRPNDAGWYILPTTRQIKQKFEFQFISPDGHPYFLRHFGFPLSYSRQVNIPTDIPVSADYDGDGIKDMAVWRPHEGMWYVLPSSGKLNLKSNQYKLLDQTVYYAVQLGLNGDIPVPGYYDGDNQVDMAVWRPTDGRWFVLPTTGDFLLKDSVPLKSPDGNTYFFREFGGNTERPVQADYDGDGLTDIALWDARTGKWSILPTSGQLFGELFIQPVPFTFRQQRTKDGRKYFSFTNFGQSGDIPVVGYYDNDDKADFAIWRPGTRVWSVIPSTRKRLPWTNTRQTIATSGLVIYVMAFGELNGIPAPGDFDGDRLWDPAVWEPTRGNWHIMATSNSIPFSTKNVRSLQNGLKEFIIQFGLPGDIPVGGMIGK